jgi:hypothetical protein
VDRKDLKAYLARAVEFCTWASAEAGSAAAGAPPPP